jgi:lysophospholipase L1-like esterase
MFFAEKETVLFQGDSITDCKRDREDPESLGKGYPLLLASLLPIVYTKTEFTFINRGISANRVRDLEARWDEDCIALKPTTLSILIGINDTWRRYRNDERRDSTSLEAFEQSYRSILTRARNELGVKLILLEQFLLPVHEELHSWREDLDPKVGVVRRLAKEFGALYIPLDGLFAAECMKKDAQFWAPDGIHPTHAGHGFIADAWMKAIV